MNIYTIKIFTAFKASAGIEQGIYTFTSKFLDCKLNDAYGWLRLRIRQSTKIGLKILFIS
ncbi:hypothetical protein [Nostoc sp.]|uniref:hypothetical protein n=1 Tax=Nostoc sp. TaxID=1180 RepID=UPI002FFD2EBC